ncbi:prepilin peptidase-dependent protein (plasmid) [Pantoea allii]|uniref:prepilin peptidase-dependent protein n=1 Tax=Pantoea TaxID=53335 RepID=UPI000B5AB805|nr:prepilin peptidase-dependent protein [Pantoea sp. AMG 501]OWY74678.1 prepilin peptidase-dependent protein [Pantoea sp. AMG 501]
MKLNSVISEEGLTLAEALDAGRGPLLVPDPGGELWNQFWDEPRWRPWLAWRLAPGVTQEGDSWDVLRELEGVRAEEGVSAVAGALFPDLPANSLTRSLMETLLGFAGNSKLCADLPSLAARIWADDVWGFISRETKRDSWNPALQAATALLSKPGADQSAHAIRDMMAVYHHPHVAETFEHGRGFRLSTLRTRPCQIVFLTPDVMTPEKPELMAVYAFLSGALMSLSALRFAPFTAFIPAAVEEMP